LKSDRLRLNNRFGENVVEYFSVFSAVL